MEPTVEFEIWQEKDGKRSKRNSAYGMYGLAEMTCAAYNKEEAENARLERRAVKSHYFVVKATTTYEKV